MLLRYDNEGRKLSNRVLNELRNIDRNCHSQDAADYIFKVFYDAKGRGEVSSYESMYRLAFKALNEWQFRKQNIYLAPIK